MSHSAALRRCALVSVRKKRAMIVKTYIEPFLSVTSVGMVAAGDTGEPFSCVTKGCVHLLTAVAFSHGRAFERGIKISGSSRNASRIVVILLSKRRLACS